MSVTRSEDTNVSSNDIYALLQNVLEKNIEIQNQIKENREEIKRDLNEVKEIFNKQLEDLQEENKKLREENVELKKKLNITERKTKKYNIVIYGVKDKNNKTEDNQEVLEVFNEGLGINCTLDNFRDIHRIGRHAEDKNRPIVIEVLNYNLKTEILASSKKLKGTGIYIAHDYSTADYNRRKILRDNLKLARTLSVEAKIVKNKLMIEEVEYSIEDLEKETPEKLQIAQENIERLADSSNKRIADESRRDRKFDPKKRQQENLHQEKASKRPTRLNSRNIN